MEYSELEDRINHYKREMDNLNSGKSNNIPFHGFPMLNKIVPGIIPGIMYKITSHSGIESKYNCTFVL